jgi:hypothetical protein
MTKKTKIDFVTAPDAGIPLSILELFVLIPFTAVSTFEHSAFDFGHLRLILIIINNNYLGWKIIILQQDP